MLDYKELAADGVLFEQLVRELLIREGFAVKWTGVGPDGGRDLLLTEGTIGPIAPFERLWVVSCKHFAHRGASVGVNDLDRSVVDSCKAAGAAGFILACSTQPSSALVTRLKEIEASSGIVCRYWDGVELEKRLLTPRTFALIHSFFPVTSKALPWAVYNAGSPSFWCAVHSGQFFYLSSRIASGTPRLQDVERIIAKLAAIPLAPAGEFGQRERLRLRAVYFDNKHENYHVFVDYLVPVARGGVVVTQSLAAKPLLDLLEDGHGLYSDEVSSWYTTYWDILRIKTNQLSDRFEEDDQSHYETFLPNFKVGSSRSSAASAFESYYASWIDAPK